jgi:hypothetical protein
MPVSFPSEICAIEAWPTHKEGVLCTQKLSDSELPSILNQIDPVRIQAFIKKLASFSTRHPLSTQIDQEIGIRAARDWLLEEYERFARESGGAMYIEIQSSIQGVADRIDKPTNISDIVATL